ncbi:hypothetical protein EGH24_04560 [Halonotius terrestris]|uniref:DUF7313 domain-containing protein n=1 Tax=Halonotius terrestris TaxID=2487750 RepID=A0A8J8PCI4_9EURY|nr:hypothetical protein [Halonotius terrestris]TQQ82723.1 hypothetical protein EGH24_04560 [Halonotius terrestris]
MHPLQFLVPLGWIETIGPILPIALFVLAVANVGTRLLSHRQHEQQAAEGDDDEALDRYAPHVFTNTGLVTMGMLFTLYRPTSGMIFMIPVIGLFVTDFFEFESRLVEARNDMELERPKAGIAISLLVVVYAAYYGLEFLYSPYLDLIFA